MIGNFSENAHHLPGGSSSFATPVAIGTPTALTTAITGLSPPLKTKSPISSAAIEQLVSVTASLAQEQTSHSFPTANADLGTDSNHTPLTVTRDITQTLYTSLPDPTKRAATSSRVTGPIIAIISLAVILLILNVFCGIWCIRRATRKSRRHIMDSTDDIFQPLNLPIGLERNRIAALLVTPKRDRYQRLFPSPPPRFSIFKRSQHNTASRRSLMDVDSPSTPFVIGDVPDEESRMVQLGDDLPPPTYCAIEGG